MNRIILSYGELKKMYSEAKEQTTALSEAYPHENLTVGQNLDDKISRLHKELARLERAKLTLGPLLDMSIDDLRSAMSY